MRQLYISRVQYTLMLLLCFFTVNSFANHISDPKGDALLVYKSSDEHQLCENKPFYITGIDIDLARDGNLSVSLSQISKSEEGFDTHLTVELIDYKGRILTTYSTPTLSMDVEEAGLDSKTIRKNRKEGRTKSAYFTENFKYQFSAEEFKIFIDNVRQIKVSFNGCDAPNNTPAVNQLTRNLPREIIDEFINKTPLVSE